MKVSTKFKVDTTICCIVIALLLLIRYMTFWCWPLTLFSGHTWRVMRSTPPQSLKILRLSILELSSDISHGIPHTMRLQPLHNCTCAVSRDLCTGGNFFPHIWNPWPQFAYSLYNFYGATIKANGVISQNSVWTCAKDHTAFCACAKSLSVQPCRKSFTTICLGHRIFR